MTSPKKLTVAIASVVAVLAAYNAVVTIPVMVALKGEGDVTAVAYRSWLLSPSTIVFDVWRVGPEGSMVKVDRSLFLAAEALKERSYSGVVLAHQGRGKFVLDGARFKTIGQEWPDQNPVYIIRTMQSDIKTFDGQPAFDSFSGGWLGVMLEEMKQHNQLHERWWLLDRLGPEAAAKLQGQAEAGQQ